MCNKAINQHCVVLNYAVPNSESDKMKKKSAMSATLLYPTKHNHYFCIKRCCSKRKIWREREKGETIKRQSLVHFAEKSNQGEKPRGGNSDGQMLKLARTYRQ